MSGLNSVEQYYLSVTFTFQRRRNTKCLLCVTESWILRMCSNHIKILCAILWLFISNFFLFRLADKFLFLNSLFHYWSLPKITGYGIEKEKKCFSLIVIQRLQKACYCIVQPFTFFPACKCILLLLDLSDFCLSLFSFRAQMANLIPQHGRSLHQG